MTGDVFAALSEHTILSRDLHGASHERDAFREGVAAGSSRPTTDGGAVFDPRPRLTGELTPGGRLSFLSGLLIGQELAVMKDQIGPDFRLVADGTLCGLYREALDVAGIRETAGYMLETAAQRGLGRSPRSLWPRRGPPMSDRFRAFDDAFMKMPLIAILRGLEPGRAGDVATLLADAGFTLAEVPSTALTVRGHRGPESRIDGPSLHWRRHGLDFGIPVPRAGGRRAIRRSPQFRRTRGPRRARRRTALHPGVLTPTEAFRALDVGATALKLFPAESANPER